MLDFSKANEWKIIETDFDPTALGKVEANFCLGNGYLGLRSATEEKYLGETRDLLVCDCNYITKGRKLQPHSPAFPRVFINRPFR